MAHCYLVFYNDDGEEQITVHRTRRSAISRKLKIAHHRLHALFAHATEDTIPHMLALVDDFYRRRKHNRLAALLNELLETESVYFQRRWLRG